MMDKLISKNKFNIYSIHASLALLAVGSIILLFCYPGWRLHLLGLLVYLLVLGYIFSDYKRVNEEVFESREKLNITNQLLQVELTGRKLIEKKLRFQSEIIKNMTEGVCLIGFNDTLIVYANPKFEEMFGYLSGEMIGKDISIVNAPADKPPEEIKKDILDVLGKTGEWHGEIKNIKKDGTSFWSYANVSLFDHSEYGKVIVAIHSNITNRKTAEEIIKRDKDWFEKEVRKTSEQLYYTMKKLENTKRLSDIGTLAATIAHELRNPLGVIKTTAYLIKKKAQNPLIDKHLTDIDKKILESEQIIKNLLNYARIKMPEYENIAVVNVLNECVDNCKSKYSKYQVEINIKGNCGDKEEISADSFQINEIFYNIIDNAFQAFPDKNGAIDIFLNYDKENNNVSISFHDNGSGIDEKDMAEIFKPFFTKRSKGTGLGLTVCNELVNLHGGTIDIKSKKDIGTTVTVNLPIGREVL